MFSNQKGLFLEAKKAKYLPNVLVAIILIFLFLIGGEVIGDFVDDFLIRPEYRNIPLVKILDKLIFEFLFVTLLVFAWVRFIEKRKVSSLGFYKENFILKYVMGFLVGALLFSLVVAILAITGNVKIIQQSSMPVGLAALSSILIILPGWMIQSATEEILTRGWVMNVIGARYSALFGLIFSGAIFGILHGMNPNVSLIAILNILLSGIFFGLYVIRSTNLWGACGAHAAWNWVQGNVYGFEVSGIEVKTGSLIDLESVGSDWFTGGIFGPEAGFAATIVLTIGIVVILFMKEKKYI